MASAFLWLEMVGPSKVWLVRLTFVKVACCADAGIFNRSRTRVLTVRHPYYVWLATREQVVDEYRTIVYLERIK